MSSFTQAMRLQSTIISALMLRNMHSQHSKTRWGIIINILEPAAMVFTIFAMRYYVSGSGVLYGIPLAVFVTTGYMPFHFHRLTVSGIMQATRTKAPSLMFPMVTSFDNVLARAINDVMIYGAAIVVVFVFLLSLYGGAPPTNLLLAIAAIALIFWYSIAFGVVAGVIARLFPTFRIIFGPIMRGTMLVSGALFLATELPPKFLVYARWNPIFNAIEMVREAFLPGYVSPVADPAYVVVFSLITSVVGMALERQTRRFKLS